MTNGDIKAEPPRKSKKFEVHIDLSGEGQQPADLLNPAHVSTILNSLFSELREIRRLLTLERGGTA
jgi:hypothetical protein